MTDSPVTADIANAITASCGPVFTTISIVIYLLLSVAALVIAAVMGIWFMAGAFVSGIGWGVGVVLWPLAALVFPPLFFVYPVLLLVLTIRHWQTLRIPVCVNLVLFLIFLATRLVLWIAVMAVTSPPNETNDAFFKRFWGSTQSSLKHTIGPSVLKVKYPGLFDYRVPSDLNDAGSATSRRISNITRTVNETIDGTFKNIKKRLSTRTSVPVTKFEYDPSSETALLKAVRDGSLEGVRAALADGLYVNEQSPNGDTALMMAASFGFEGIVKLLLERQADPDLTNDNGKTALDVAIENQRPRIAEILKNAMKKDTPA